jgi:CheY-like chemotaxis protein
MMSIRILHVDDDPDIREIVKLSLDLHPIFEVASCASGEDALAISSSYEPDLVLCDVMMPGMDGPAVLAHLHENPITAKTPVVFMTARVQPKDLDQFKMLGAAGVIIKPFDPMALADKVQEYLNSAKRAAEHDFGRRLRSDAGTLKIIREKLINGSASLAVLEDCRSCAHKLAGAAGVYGFQEMSRLASILEEALIEILARPGCSDPVSARLDTLLEHIERESLALPSVLGLPEPHSCESSGLQQNRTRGGDDRYK